MTKRETLCWQCEWATGKDKKCLWATKFEPVEGWTAIPTKVRADKFSRHTVIDSFIVCDCPLFELMEEIKRRNEEKKNVKKRKKYSKYKPTDYDKISELRNVGKTYKEIAEILGVSDKSIYRAVHRGKKK